MLDEEENSDKQLRQQLGERWSRTSSDKLTAPIRAEANKYRAMIDNAIQADKVVQDRFGSSREGIDILSKSDGSPVAALQWSPVVAELRKLMETVDTIKAERDVIEAEIKNAKCDMCKWDFIAKDPEGLDSDRWIPLRGGARIPRGL